MSSEEQEVEPDAWQRKDDAYYTYPPTWHGAVDTNYDEISRFKPLFSESTIQEAIDSKATIERNGHEFVRVDKLKEVFSSGE